MVKIRNTELLGASVVVQGDGLDEAYALARNTAARDGSTLVHPYDDERIIAGQGTVGLEILGENRDFDAVVVPIGGGGLISGIAVAVERSEEHTSELQSLMRISFAVFCLKKKNKHTALLKYAKQTQNTDAPTLTS